MRRATFTGRGMVSCAGQPSEEVQLDLALTDSGWGGTMQPIVDTADGQGFAAWVAAAYRAGRPITVRPTGPRREATARIVDLRGHGAAQRAVLSGTDGAPF